MKKSWWDGVLSGFNGEQVLFLLSVVCFRVIRV